MNGLSLAARWIVALLLAVALIVQLHFFNSYPQPTVFGDPAGYLQVGRGLEIAAGRLYAGEPAAVVFASVRGALVFFGVGVLFALMDAVRGDASFFRLVFAAFNVLGMLGCFLLARRLSNSFAAGAFALGIAALHPSFATHTPRLYPDPVTGCSFVWAAWLYVEAMHRDSRRHMAGAGFLLMSGLFVRSQLMAPVGALLALALTVTAPRWARDPRARGRVGAFLLGALPLGLAWGLAAWVSTSEITAKVAEDNFALRQYYPYGFWQFLDTDGWEGPYRLKTEPFYKSMEAEARGDPDLLRSRRRQIAFTVRYVLSRPWESLLRVLDNVYRLYDRPANPYRWDYPFPVRYQELFQKGIILLALAGSAVFIADSPANAWVLFVPLALAIVHGLSFPWPRYAMPALLTVIGFAGAFLGWLMERVRAGVSRSLAVATIAFAGISLALFGAHPALLLHYPTAERGAHLFAILMLTATPFLPGTLMAGGTVRARTVAAYAVVAILVLAHAARDGAWHQLETRFDAGVTAVEQEILLSPEAIARLRSASEVFLVMDLDLPRGDPRGLILEVNGRSYSGTSLVPTMPHLREATERGGRDWRGYPQWWALALDGSALPSAGQPLRVKLSSDRASEMILRGDRFESQDRWYEGPSFGDWPHVVAGKLEYDGDYRIPVRMALESYATKSYVWGQEGTRVAVPSVHRIRLIALAEDQGGARWQSAVLPASPRVALGFAAYSGLRGRTALAVEGRNLFSLPLGKADDFELREGAFRLCFRARHARGRGAYGDYLLIGPAAAPGKRVLLEVGFRSGMSDEPLFFVLDRKWESNQLAEALGACRAEPGTVLVDGAALILDASRDNYPEDTGRWRAASVF